VDSCRDKGREKKIVVFLAKEIGLFCFVFPSFYFF
jgi:hypothetical protein